VIPAAGLYALPLSGARPRRRRSQINLRPRPSRCGRLAAAPKESIFSVWPADEGKTMCIGLARGSSPARLRRGGRLCIGRQNEVVATVLQKFDELTARHRFAVEVALRLITAHLP
jgi:hypothetical protein